MNKLSTALFGVMLSATAACTSANANSATVDALVTNVKPLETTVIDTSYRSVCRTVQVPVYETRRRNNNASTGDVALGAVIGGAIGNQFGGGSGKDAMTVLGAIVGADMARNNSSTYQVQNGYRNEQECYQEPVNNMRTITDGYAVRYEWNGLRGEIHTNRQYNVGDTIPVTVTIN